MRCPVDNRPIDTEGKQYYIAATSIDRYNRKLFFCSAACKKQYKREKNGMSEVEELNFDRRNYAIFDNYSSYGEG